MILWKMAANWKPLGTIWPPPLRVKFIDTRLLIQITKNNKASPSKIFDLEKVGACDFFWKNPGKNDIFAFLEKFRHGYSIEQDA